MQCKYVIFLLLIWISYGIIGAGFDNAYFQRKWSRQCDGRSDLGKALIVIPLGPINLIVSYLLTGFGEYGWSLKLIANPACENSR